MYNVALYNKRGSI